MYCSALLMLGKDRLVYPQTRTSPAGQEDHAISHGKAGAQAVQALCAEATLLDKALKQEGFTFQKGARVPQILHSWK